MISVEEASLPALNLLLTKRPYFHPANLRTRCFHRESTLPTHSSGYSDTAKRSFRHKIVSLNILKALQYRTFSVTTPP